MKRRTLRRLLKWGIPLDVAFLTLVMLDYFRWESQFVAPIFVLFALYLVFLLVLLLLSDKVPFLRLEGSTERRNIVVYPRRPHG